MTLPTHTEDDPTRSGRAGGAPEDGAGRPASRPARRRPDLLGRRSRAPWWFLLPGLALYAFVVLVPSVRGGVLAFTDWNGISETYDWIGFDNFVKLWNTEIARDALVRTVIIAVAVTIIQNAIGLLLALGVNSHIKSRNVLRVLLFAPAVLTPVVVAYLWRNLLAPTGAVNSFLDAVGLDGLQREWLGDSRYAMWSIVMIVVWQFAGYSMVIFLAGLQSIPQEIYEAAELDGASRFRRFTSIELPLLAPATTINLMLSIIGGIKLFDQVYATTGGGPANSTQTLSTLIYRYAFNSGQFAFAIALAVVLTLLVAVFAAAQYNLLRRAERKAS
ncbi:sugar ABC transporter permease [Cellulomonas sp. DKR-3]|uniref:Sugar ABC transporter permease n=1 Tax=Cellulomonas fulva TaxID=2835530 RepID=A0ABS5TXG3_9CELL|nr:sugar ABC transporter permease [Cellulomonas fulva]MBT0993843.1 sugar ABC transporter permease [Cellulomonas fulva]